MNWNGYRLAGPEDVERLQAEVGHRAGMGMETDLAHKSAYHDYRRVLHNEAAAHHLRGSERAARAGHRDVAERHQAMFRAHIRAAGHRTAPTVVPPEVQAHLNAVQDPGHHFFAAHRGDALLGS